MCFLWGENGVYSSGNKKSVPKEMEWSVIQRIFSEIGQHKPMFIISGGEPLLYSKFRELAVLLKKHRTYAYINTNGYHIGRYIDVIENNPYLIFYVSLDGTKNVNDALRGGGVFEKVVNNLRRLRSLKTRHYIGLQFTLMPENVSVLYDLCREAVVLGVDWILINLRWNLTQGQAKAYEEQLKRDFGVEAWSQRGYLTPSYAVSDKVFIEQYHKVRKARWPVHISCYLKRPEDLDSYISCHSSDAFCYKQWVRMDVLSTGDVTPCGPYPDLIFGNLKDKSVDEIWNGGAYQEFRRYRRSKAFPVCQKCDCLYLYSKDRMML